MEEISKVVSDLVYKKYNKVRIAQELLKREYATQEIKDALKKSKVKQRNTNQILGVLLIIIGVLSNFYTKSTYINNYFRFDFSSQADFMLFNERILKPTIAISLIYLGINLLISRVNINKNVKIVLFTLLGVFTLFILSYDSYIFPIIFSVVSLLLVSLTELPQKIQNLEMEKIFPYINKKWKGSPVYIMIIFGVILMDSSQVEFVFVQTGERSSSASLGFIDHFLLYAKPILFYGGLLTAFLLSMNFSKFKISLFILTGLAVITLIISLFHTNFQNIIYGCCAITISTIPVLFKKDKND
ncbi:hypothetical protein [Zobellia uliginosa]|uniref:hypothetical protein n=1 Tax=Zobellia uliginosa TaxID=143224 RepID=UPI0026E42AA2|nr:hypothetical protein [Zobellia uliginosa]MDO6518600.1 hypothetical protein [Zobellia uliginosa]